MKKAIQVRLKLRKQALFRDAQRCVFCGRSPTTHEHIYPRRWHKYMLSPRTAKNEVAIEIRYPKRLEWASFKSPPMRDWQPKCVCGSCNNGWMRQLEQCLDPLMSRLLQAKRASLSDADVAALAMWAIMKVMVVHHRATRAKQRRTMFKQQKAPQDWWAMWIGTYTRKKWKAEFVSAPFRIDPGFKFADGKRPRGSPPNAVAATQIIGQLYVHTVYCAHPKFATGWKYTPPRVPALKGNLVKIWPPTGVGIRNWPQARLTENDAQTVAYGLVRALMRWAEKAGLAMPIKRS
jgi:hypothetical protein